MYVYICLCEVVCVCVGSYASVLCVRLYMCVCVVCVFVCLIHICSLERSVISDC